MNKSKKELKKQQIYLNNLIKDDIFIALANKDNLESYFIGFPSDTTDVKKLNQYIHIVEYMFMVNGIKYVSLQSNNNN